MKNNFNKLLNYLWKIWFICLAIFIFYLCISIQRLKSIDTTYLSWPGTLPDNKLYKIKLIRDKLSEKIIFDSVKKVEFDLVMANKTIYASKILLDKGEISLAKQTALKGEDYYSKLVQDYNNALLQNKKIPQELDRRITNDAKKHAEIFQYEVKKTSGGNKKDFQAAENFLYINTNFINGLRTPKTKK